MVPARMEGGWGYQACMHAWEVGGGVAAKVVARTCAHFAAAPVTVHETVLVMSLQLNVVARATPVW